MKRLYRIVLVATLFVMITSVQGQSMSPHIISTSGCSLQNNTTNLSWTLGETVVETFGADEYFLTQGFQQPAITSPTWLTGDANCDGTVDVLDVITIINFILETDPEPFCFDNADVNLDGTVDVLDAIGTINIILYGNKSTKASIDPDPAYLLLHPEGVDFISDGHVTALQFSIYDIHAEQLKSQVETHEMLTSAIGNKLNLMLVSLNNQTIPKGWIRLIDFDEKTKQLKWGEAMGGDPNAQYVEIIKQVRYEPLDVQSLFRAFPNPSGGEVTIEINCHEELFAQLSLVNIPGNKVQYLHEGKLMKGMNRMVLNTKSFSPGVYILHLQARSMHKEVEIYHQQIKLAITY